jgi:perosamine synthetase
MPTIVAHEGAAFVRDRLLSEFKAENIDGRVFFWPLSDLPPGMHRPVPTPVAHGLYKRAVNLPSYHGMSTEEIARVVEVVRRNFIK